MAENLKFYICYHGFVLQKKKNSPFLYLLERRSFVFWLYWSESKCTRLYTHPLFAFLGSIWYVKHSSLIQRVIGINANIKAWNCFLKFYIRVSSVYSTESEACLSSMSFKHVCNTCSTFWFYHYKPYSQSYVPSRYIRVIV